VKTYANQPSGTLDRARQLRRDATEAEKRLWRALREKLPQAKWRRQMPIGPYFADFACFAERLIVELDGGQHASASEYDAARTRFMEGQNYRVLRFWNNDVMENMEGVLETIAAALSPSPPQPAAGALPLPAGEG
jgi:very-short-patch-repair endonuclease